VVDAIWSFTYRDDARRFLTNSVSTVFGQPSRTDRLRALVSATGCWDDWQHALRPGFTSLTQAVPYITSHDVSDGWRWMTVSVLEELRGRGVLDTSLPAWEAARRVVDIEDGGTPGLNAVREAALVRTMSAFVLLLTSVGMPMFLAGEEFADTHDTDPNDAKVKMSDPINWRRAENPQHAAMLQRVSQLVALRKAHPALQREAFALFYTHPAFDQDGAPRVFAYARLGTNPLGNANQVIVIGNLGPDDFPAYEIPAWPWGQLALAESAAAAVATPPSIAPGGTTLSISLRPFEVRVFTS
jgi:1,4-alpha-glucan branching enzyme